MCSIIIKGYSWIIYDSFNLDNYIFVFFYSVTTYLVLEIRQKLEHTKNEKDTEISIGTQFNSIWEREIWKISQLQNLKLAHLAPFTDTFLFQHDEIWVVLFWTSI